MGGGEEKSAGEGVAGVFAPVDAADVEDVLGHGHALEGEQHEGVGGAVGDVLGVGAVIIAGDFFGGDEIVAGEGGEECVIVGDGGIVGAQGAETAEDLMLAGSVALDLVVAGEGAEGFEGAAGLFGGDPEEFEGVVAEVPGVERLSSEEGAAGDGAGVALEVAPEGGGLGHAVEAEGSEVGVENADEGDVVVPASRRAQERVWRRASDMITTTGACVVMAGGRLSIQRMASGLRPIWLSQPPSKAMAGPLTAWSFWRPARTEAKRVSSAMDNA